MKKEKWIKVTDKLPEYDKTTGKNLVDLFEVKTVGGNIKFAYYGIAGWCINTSWYSEYLIKDVVKWHKV